MRCHQQFSKQEYLSSYFRIILSFLLFFSLLSHDSRTCDLRVFWMNRKCYSFSPEQNSTPNCANRSPPTIQYRRLYRVYRRVFEDSCVYAAYIVHYSGPALSDRGNIEKNRGKNGAHPFWCCTSDPLCVQRSTFVKKNSVIDNRDREKKRKRVKVRKRKREKERERDKKRGRE